MLFDINPFRSSEPKGFDFNSLNPFKPLEPPPKHPVREVFEGTTDNPVTGGLTVGTVVAIASVSSYAYWLHDPVLAAAVFFAFIFGALGVKWAADAKRDERKR